MKPVQHIPGGSALDFLQCVYVTDSVGVPYCTLLPWCGLGHGHGGYNHVVLLLLFSGMLVWFPCLHGKLYLSGSSIQHLMQKHLNFLSTCYKCFVNNIHMWVKVHFLLLNWVEHPKHGFVLHYCKVQFLDKMLLAIWSRFTCLKFLWYQDTVILINTDS